MARIAVIGAGISGLAAAYYLSRKHEVWVFEKDTRLGGHTHTVMVDRRLDGPLPVDTGFIVHNRKTYPNFCRLLENLGVETQASDMSFGVYSPETGFEYSSRGARGFFATPRNAVSVTHWRLLREIVRFNRDAQEWLASSAGSTTVSDLILGVFVGERRYSNAFLEHYLYPMAAAVWSMPPDRVASFPALTLLRFFENHGMLGLNTHPQWRVIKGGSHAYLEPLTAPYRDRIRTGVEIRNIVRAENRVKLQLGDGSDFLADEVVFACHGDQVLPLLPDASDTERDVMGAFENSRNQTVLHTDSGMLPRRRAARASWNYRLGRGGEMSVTYHMNRLQSLAVDDDYCVTLNATDAIDHRKIVRQLVYEHPLYTARAIRTQARWAEISGHRHTHYCGAYWGHGFHEDGVNSALRVARMLGVAV